MHACLCWAVDNTLCSLVDKALSAEPAQFPLIASPNTLPESLEIGPSSDHTSGIHLPLSAIRRGLLPKTVKSGLGILQKLKILAQGTQRIFLMSTARTKKPHHSMSVVARLNIC